MRRQEQSGPLPCPRSEFVVPGENLVLDPFDAEDLGGVVLLIESLPECRAEVEAIMEILRLDEHIRIQQVGGHMTPSRSPMPLNVASFFNPSIWNASA